MANNDQVYNRRLLEKGFGFSQAVLVGDYLFVSGCVSWDMDGHVTDAADWDGQLAAVYADIDATLKVHGLDAGDIVKETIYCRDMDGLIAANPTRMRYYQDVATPASTWVQISRLVKPDLLLEVEVVAYRHR